MSLVIISTESNRLRPGRGCHTVPLAREPSEVAYWYPTHARTAALEAELSSLERLSRANKPDTWQNSCRSSPTSSAKALNTEGFPQHQIGQWVWLASQFRMLAVAVDRHRGSRRWRSAELSRKAR